MNKINIQEENPHGTPYFPFQALSQEDTCGQYFAPYHWHDEAEFLSVTRGSLLLCTESETYTLKAGNVYFINPGTVHGIFGKSRESHHYALVFPLDLLSFSKYDICQNEFLSPVLSGRLLFPDGRQLPPSCREKIAGLIRQAAQQYGDIHAVAAPLSIKILLLQILEELFTHQAFLSGEDSGFLRSASREHPLKPVFSYIEAHYMEKISLEQLSSALHMNKNYFCKFFKEKVGKTPFAYLNEYRINQAAAMLLKQEASITEIALNTGFENMSYFIRQFKHYKGCTPSAFRGKERVAAVPVL